MGNRISGIKLKISKAGISEILIISAICVIAFALRIVFLDKLSFWIDESTSVVAAKGLFEKGSPILPSGDYYARSFVHVWVLAQSFKLFGISEFSARFPSVIFGTVSVGLIYYFAKSLGHKETGLITAFMLAFSAWAIWFSREARMYALLQLVYLFAVYMLWLGFEGRFKGSQQGGFSARNWLYLLLAALGFIIGFFTHELMALFLGIFWLYALIMFALSISQEGWTSALRNKYGMTSIILSVFGLITLVLLIAVGKLTLGGGVAEGVVPGHLITASYFGLLEHFLEIYPFLTIMSFIGSLALVKTRDKSGIFLLLTFWLPAIAVSFTKVSRARYLYMIYPSFLLLALIGVVFMVISVIGLVDYNNLLNKFRSKIWPKAVLLLVLAMFSLMQYRAVKNQPHGRVPSIDLYVAYFPNWKLASKIDSSDKTIVTTDPITAYYYFGKVDYMVRLTDSNLYAHWLDKNGHKKKVRERYIGARFLGTFEKLRSVIEKNDNILLVVQRDLWEKKLTEESREYIWKKLKYENEFSDDSIYVFTSS